MKILKHDFGTGTHQNDARLDRFNEHCQRLTTVKLLCQLTRAAQQHRGATMAFLSGDESYLKQAAKLQADIETILLILDSNESVIISQRENKQFYELLTNWQTIQLGWQSDTIINNFQFHSHFIELLKKQIRLTTNPLLKKEQGGEPSAYLTPLLDLLLHQLFDNIEALAQLRGLSTNAAIVHACGQDFHSRISFLLKDIPKQNILLITSSQSLPKNTWPLTSIDSIKQHEKSLQRLLLSIKIQILESPSITIDSLKLFNLATEIIDQRWLGLTDDLQAFDRYIFDQLLNK
jgi:hypothetical protein